MKKSKNKFVSNLKKFEEDVKKLRIKSEGNAVDVQRRLRGDRFVWANKNKREQDSLAVKSQTNS